MPNVATEKNYKKDLQSIVCAIIDNFGKQRYESFFDELLGCSAFILNAHGLRCQPSIKSWHTNHKKVKRPKPPEGFSVWLDIFEDFEGMSYYVFYPKGVRKGKHIEVLFSGCFFNGFIDWVHGEAGLFNPYIYELLVLENFHCSSDSDIINFIEKSLK